MSDFQIDDINNLQSFATMITDIVQHWFLLSTDGSCRALPAALVPDPNTMFPNMAQVGTAGGFSGFHDAEDLYRSYNDSRRALVGDPGQLTSAPTSSSLASFIDGLNHLQTTALAIFHNYDAASKEDKLSANDVATQLNAPASQSAPTAG